jgi:sugar phosphate isomerase/epimerase
MEFAISTHLYHDRRLERAHLEEVAAFGFEAVELFATRAHFDYHDPRAIAALAEWLRGTGLALHAIHAPITTGPAGSGAAFALSNAATDAERRQRALRETEAALAVARQIPVRCLVVHLGVPEAWAGPGDNDRDAARRSLEAIHALAAPLGLRVAAEVIPNALSTAAGLVDWLERDVELDGVGVCLDYGHAFLMGDLVDAIETAGGHLVTTHVHDNHGRRDEHLVPFDGAIDWARAVAATQKVGYDGRLVLELASAADSKAALARAREARTRLERLFL